MAKVRKAIMAALTGAASAAAVAVTDGVITTQEWLTILGAAVVAGYAVWQVPNAPIDPVGQTKSVR